MSTVTPLRKPLAPAPESPHPAPAPKPKSQQIRTSRILPVSFGLAVLLPALMTAAYLWFVAVDQYASEMGFAVRSEEAPQPTDLLSGLGALSGSSASDTDLLYAFLQSQSLISRLDQTLDLRAMFAADDPVFGFAASGTIEDLTRFWPRMVRTYYDPGTGLLTLRVQAFRPEDAQALASAIADESAALVNQLSALGVADAITHAESELIRAEARLIASRQAVTRFRSSTQIIDPTIDLQGRMMRINSLEAERINAEIALQVLSETTRKNDPRIVQAERQIAALDAHLDNARTALGTASGQNNYAHKVGQYEALIVEQSFAETAHATARTLYESARAEADRQTRYLAVFAPPTLAERALYPQRFLIWITFVAFALLLWATAVLVITSLRDRR